jgi:predicted nicotinamide N-methyase
MASPSQARLRAFVRGHTRLREVPDVPGLRLHTGDDVMEICRLAGIELGQPDPPLPFWAFPWAGGLAIACHLLGHPDVVAGRRVVDIASGSGLCAIVAARCGAADVAAFDVDPLAEAAATLNARANDVQLVVRRSDLLETPPPDCDVILAGDVCYEETMAGRMLDWLGRAAAAGTTVLIGDPRRRYLPAGLEPLATYRVHTSRELEDAALKESGVFTIRASTPAA